MFGQQQVEYLGHHIDAMGIHPTENKVHVISEAPTPTNITTPDGVGTNSGIDYWNGTLDWTIGLSYFPFLDKLLHLFLELAYFF